MGSSDAYININLHVTDDQSGIQFVYAGFISPSGQYLYDVRELSVQHPTDANVQLAVYIPQSSEAGTWPAFVYLWDMAGHQQWLDNATLAGMGFPSTLTVTGQSGGDTTPPVLTSFDLDPKSVNVASSDATVTINLHVTDDLSGFANANVTFVSPSGQSQSVSATLTTGTSLDGDAQATLTLPKASEAGTWSVSSVDAYDADGNHQPLDTAALSALGFPTSLTVSDTPQLTDTTPPVLVSFDFTPKSVDVTNGDATVNFNLHVTDDLSGYSWGYAYFYSPSYGQYAYGYFYLAAGTPLNANLQGTLTLPQNSEPGDWTVSGIYLVDTTGNQQSIDNTTLSSLGFPTKLTVISQNADVTPPQLNSFALAPASVNVSSGPQAITFTIGASDDKSGLDFCQRQCYQTIGLQSPSGKQSQYGGSQATQLSGTSLNGVWQVSVSLPKYAEAGVWKVNYVYLHDMTGNAVSFNATDLQSRGFPTTVTVASNPSDTVAPNLTSLDFTPNFADTTKDYKLITLTLGATDNLSGLSYGSIQFSSPSGIQNLWISAGGTPLAGTATNGTWQGTGYLPQYSEAGTWTLGYAYLSDPVGNYAYYNTAQLQALNFPTSLEVILPSLVPDGTISNPAVGGTVQDKTFGARAAVTVPPGVLTQANTKVSLDVLSSDLHLPIPSGFTTNGTNFVNISLVPEPTPPFPAPGLTVVLPLLNQMAPGTTLTLYRVDPVSGNLTPEPSIGGGAATGTVDGPDGLSATFTGVANLSTVAGLIPSGVVLGDLDGDGKVNCADISIVRVAFGKKLGQAGFDNRADTNKDKVINVRDLSFVSRYLPKSVVCRITATGAIPVPNTSTALINTRR